MTTATPSGGVPGPYGLAAYHLASKLAALLVESGALRETDVVGALNRTAASLSDCGDSADIAAAELLTATSKMVVRSQDLRRPQGF